MQDVLRRLRALDPEKRAAVFAQLAERGEEFNVHPVSSGQRRLWLLDQLHPGSAVYNVPYAFRLRGSVDSGALGAALIELGRRHEVLRTVFLDLDGDPRQVILPEPQFSLVVTHADVEDREAFAAERAAEAAQEPFSLADGPLLRAELIVFDSSDALLLVSMHHIVCDGWSTQLLFSEWQAAYSGLDLGAAPTQYLDFSRWQTEWLRGPEGARLLDYWTEQLAGVPPVLELPTDHPRPAVMKMRGGVVSFAWPASLKSQLDAFCLAERVTPFMVLLTAWNVLLHRYSGADDIVVGTNVGARRAEIENALGFFVNTVAIRSTVDSDRSFRSLLHQVRDTTLAAQQHQDLPFERVVEALAPPRSTAHQPVIQTIVGMEDSQHEIFSLPGVVVSRVASHSGTAKWDLELGVTSTEGGITGLLEYDSALYRHSSARRLLGHLETLLGAGLADPSCPVGRLTMITPAERAQLVEAWNPQVAPRLDGVLVHELAEASADRTPDAVALVFENQSLTYRELDSRANQLAHQLRSLGIGRGDFVGISLPRSIDLVVAQQGVLKSGAAYVPLDPEYPADRLAYMVSDSGLRVVVTLERFASRFPGVDTLPLDSVDLSAFPVDRPQRTVEPDDLAYVIYTSGSTGKPKGAMLPHRGVVNLADELARMIGIGPGNRMLQFASFSFDVSVADIMVTLRSGATVVLAAQHDLQPGPDLARTICEQRVDFACLPPTVLRLTDPAAVPGLRTLMAGGEACPDEVAAAWAPGRRFINIYGPTEASIWITSAECSGTESPLPIGRPISGNTAHVLDVNREPVPVGVPGELYLGGVQVARGYLNRPELTAERFVSDPFSGGRLYRTGDLARFLPDGQIEFLRRMDDQIKLRGYRIELGEIQTAVSQHPSVRAAVVIAREDVPGDVRLVAYAVAADGCRIDGGELRAHLRRGLPEYMVPSAFVEVPTIPRNPNGKLDHRALPKPSAQSSRVVVPAGNQTERVISDVWREVLRMDRVGADDNFFDLGGNSVLLVKARSKLAEVFAREVPTVTLFTYPTVRALAAHFDGTGTTGSRSAGNRSALLARGRKS
ncbi:amino acid adenylation domain-containing protein [Lentzea sp. BCCO 10_0856]|uniref:Amino acid adenylation domain-containing protein n=1 Tax=Lentzea miocenica TaxID=3095431 RepID=A0ABU4T1F1_9PSEU|nr:amino acid adenylation domain-containing protein [Lentzea sp. BCCO 10_0856]MDX8031979.1 amino acid adenylation domain-containing protein [Lentzea sp. BCCO 10_0856]